MVELIGLLSLMNIGLTKWFKQFWIPIVLRLIQLVLLVVIAVKDIQSYIGDTLGITEFVLLPTILILVLSSFEFERIKVKRWVKELLFFTMMVFVTSKLLIIAVISSLVLVILIMVSQRVRFIDFISIALMLLISVVYFSELASTVHSISDKYYIFFTTYSEIIFQNLLILFFIVQSIKTWGMKRTTLITPILISLILLLKFKNAFNEIEMLKQLAPMFFVAVALFSFKKFLISKSIASAVNCLFSFALFVPLLNVVNLRFEVALASLLLSSILLYSLRLINIKRVSRGSELRPVLIFANLLNLSAFPLGLNGLSLIDMMATSGDIITIITSLVVITISWIVLYISFVDFQEGIKFNIWDVDNLIKTITFFVIVFNLYLIYINLSPLLVGSDGGWKIVKFIDPDFIITSNLKETYRHNLIFVSSIILFSLFIYGMKLLNFNSIWRIKFNFINKFSLSGKTWKLKRHTIPSENLSFNRVVSAIDTIGQTSSYQISLILFVLYLIISLVFLEF